MGSRHRHNRRIRLPGRRCDLRIFRHYSTWEDWHGGLYAVTYYNEEHGVRLAARLLGSPAILGPAMLHVVTTWSTSADVNLSNSSRNHQAWIGQATCCYLCGVPEFITKRAWWTLTDEQRDTANGLADIAAQVWTVSKTPQLEILCQNES